MDVLKKVWSYLTFKKQTAPEEKGSYINTKVMHGINKISIFMFLLGFIVLLLKWVVL